MPMIYSFFCRCVLYFACGATAIAKEDGENMRKAYALFDFDGTLIKGDSIVRFCRYAHQKGLCSTRQLAGGAWASALYFLHLKSAEQSKMAALAFLKGRSERELSRFCQGFFHDELRPRLRKKGLAEIALRKTQGAQVLLVTASPSFYLAPLKRMLGLAEIIGTRMDVDESGCFTGLICGENCKGLQKPLRLAEYLAATGDRLDYESSYAYGDSASDAPMLHLCGHKVAVNPKQKLQNALKQAQGVAIVRWDEPHIGL